MPEIRPTPEPAARGLPETVGRYQIRRELGRGMMGVVYLAQDPDLGREIALKVIQLPAGASEADRLNFEGRFFAEAQSAARLTHPGIVIVHDVGRDPNSGALYMALQLLPGQTLDHLLNEKGKLDWRTALRIGKAVAEGLHHAHSEGVVHRDIKPANIMILPSGDAKIMDFGVAKIEASTLTATGTFLGTPLYMSPEQAMARPLDGRSDVFSLGSVLYEMLTGAAPFMGDSVTKILFQVMSHEAAPLSNLRESVSPSIDLVLKRCLAKDVQGRYVDAGSLANDLGNILDGRVPGGAAWPPPPGFADTAIADLPPPTPPAVTTSASPPDRSAVETRNFPKPAPKISRRSIAVAGGILGLAALGWLVARTTEPPPVARLVPEASGPIERQAAVPEPEARAETPESDAPAGLIVDFQHTLKTGVLKVYVDDLNVIDESFGGSVTRKIVGLTMRNGRLTQTLEVTPGRREVRVQVSWDDETKTEASVQVFRPGRKLLLEAKLGSLGGLRKNLSLKWR